MKTQLLKMKKTSAQIQLMKLLKILNRLKKKKCQKNLQP